MYRLMGMRELYEGSSWPDVQTYGHERELYEGSSWPDVHTSGQERVIRREFVNMMYWLFGKERGNQVFIKHYSDEINLAPLVQNLWVARCEQVTSTYLFIPVLWEVDLRVGATAKLLKSAKTQGLICTRLKTTLALSCGTVFISLEQHFMETYLSTNSQSQ